MYNPPRARATDLVIMEWYSRMDKGILQRKTVEKYQLELQRIELQLALRGFAFADLTPGLAEQVILAPGPNRSGQPAPSSSSTQRHRRTVITSAFRILKSCGVAVADPARDVKVQHQKSSSVRVVTAAEVAQARSMYGYILQPTRHASALALTSCGAHPREAAETSVADLDLNAARAWVHGDPGKEARWIPLDAWALRVLRARKHYIVQLLQSPADLTAAFVVVISPGSSGSSRHSSTDRALADVLGRIGLHGHPDVKPSSVTAYAGAEEYARTGRIEDAARLLGMRSLDRTAKMIGSDWRVTGTDAHGGAVGQVPGPRSEQDGQGLA